jgi:hypothetical protein
MQLWITKMTSERASSTSDLLARSLPARNERLAAQDMVSTDEAAGYVGATRAIVETWITEGRCIGLSQSEGRSYRVPKWQFEPALWSLIPKVAEALGVTEGWTLLAFLERPQEGLGGATPRVAIEQGHAARVLALAEHEGN